ncbi:MAG: isoaspartyl peptidase/L-asparaginase, partial [Gemmatimonadota bacterium]
MHSGPTLVHHGLAAALALGLAFGASPRVAAAQTAQGSHHHGAGTEHQHGAGHQHDPSHHAQHHADNPIVIAIHGGAGTIRRGSMTPEMEQAYRAKLEEALRAGYAVLQQGGTSLDAVVAAIVILEDSPLFNAGKGAVFTNAGTNELDSSIMDGATLRAGAVAGVKTVKNPIRLARAVMEKSPHVMMAGAGAEAFAAEQGLEIVDPSYFFTESRWEALQRAKAQEADRPVLRDEEASLAFPDDYKFGTVGAVALDRHGNLAAGTSTGGMTNKRWG